MELTQKTNIDTWLDFLNWLGINVENPRHKKYSEEQRED